jgi:hypothetical protein
MTLKRAVSSIAGASIRNFYLRACVSFQSERIAAMQGKRELTVLTRRDGLADSF